MAVLNRRQVVSSIVAAGAASVLSADAAAQENTGAAGPFMVRSEAGRNGSPWLIRGITPIEVKVSGKDVGGRYATILVHTPPGRGPELHVHLHQNELFYVVAGRIGLQCGQEKMVLGVGDTFMAPMQVPHAYVTLGSETASLLNVFDPAGNIEAFFSEYVKVLNTNGPPDRTRMEAVYSENGLKVVGSPLVTRSFAG